MYNIQIEIKDFKNLIYFIDKMQFILDSLQINCLLPIKNLVQTIIKMLIKKEI